MWLRCCSIIDDPVCSSVVISCTFYASEIIYVCLPYFSVYNYQRARLIGGTSCGLCEVHEALRSWLSTRRFSHPHEVCCRAHGVSILESRHTLVTAGHPARWRPLQANSGSTPPVHSAGHSGWSTPSGLICCCRPRHCRVRVLWVAGDVPSVGPRPARNAGRGHSCIDREANTALH